MQHYELEGLNHEDVSMQLKIEPERILLAGASRGAELALHLASRYDFLGVIALVPPSVSIPYIDKNQKVISSWTFNGEEVPYINLDYKNVKRHGWLSTMTRALQNNEPTALAKIKVQNIQGFVFMSSASNELWPSELPPIV